MPFRKDLFGAKFMTWNTLLGRLSNVQLSQEFDEVRYNLHENRFFLVDSTYRVFAHSEVPLNNNKKKNMKMKVG